MLQTKKYNDTKMKYSFSVIIVSDFMHL